METEDVVKTRRRRNARRPQTLTAAFFAVWSSMDVNLEFFFTDAGRPDNRLSRAAPPQDASVEPADGNAHGPSLLVIPR
jgi:hypothetical protein